MTPKVEHYPQRDKRYNNRDRCSYQVLQFPNQPDEQRKPCKHNARYKLNGVKLCQLHAGYICLNYALEQSKEG